MKTLQIKPPISFKFIDDNLFLSDEKKRELVSKLKYFFPLRKDTTTYFVVCFDDKISLYTKDLIHLRDVPIEIQKVIPTSQKGIIGIISDNAIFQIIDILNNKTTAKINLQQIENAAIYLPMIALIANNELSIVNIRKKNDFKHVNIDTPKHIKFFSKKILFLSYEDKIVGYNFEKDRNDFEIEINNNNFFFVNHFKYMLIVSDKLIVYDLVERKILDKIPLKDENLIDITEILGTWVLTYENSIDVIDFREKVTYELDIDKTHKNRITSYDEYNFYVLKEDYSIVTIDIQKLISDTKKTEKIKILTVDDSKTIRRIIKNALENYFKDEVEVYEAEDGWECLQFLERNPDTNIIFMDWNMPEMDGKTAVEKINLDPKYRHVKIVMATTEGTKQKVISMIKMGVTGYLVKPLKPDAVLKITDKLIKTIRQENRRGGESKEIAC